MTAENNTGSHGAGPNDHDKRSRHRGVCASRAKLSAALAEAGIRTRAALAERIADIEGLESAPRDLVYRAFRQQPIDWRTLTRIARALDAPLHSLLLSEDELTAAERLSPNAAPSGSRRRSQVWPAAAAVALAATVLLAWRLAGNHEAGMPAADAPAVKRDLSGLAIVVRPFDGEAGTVLAGALRQALEPLARVASAGAVAALPAGEDAARVASRLGADMVIDGRVVTVGRHAGVRLLVYEGGVRRALWAAALPRRALAARKGELAHAMMRALTAVPGSGREVAPPAAQTALLEGLHYLDQSRTELNVRRATTRFEAALRAAPDYAAAHAGLCRALVEGSLISSDPRALEDAEGACTRAAALAPALPSVEFAQAGLARRSGRHTQAAVHYDALLAAYPEHTDALLGSAENALAAWRRSGAAADHSQALDLARRAAEIEPDFWKPFFTLARVHFFSGDVNAAIRAGEAAVAADANVFSLTNLGTTYFCRGDHDAALAHYLRARELAPDAPLGDGQIAVAYYFARDFDQAVRLFKAAVEAESAGGEPSRHEMWGNLADAYRQAGRTAAATDAYVRAIEVAERRLLARGDSPPDAAHLTYYYTVLTRLAPERVPEAIAAELEPRLAELSQAVLDPQAVIRLAEAWALLGNLDRARAAYARGTGHCPGFGATPDLDVLRAGSAVAGGRS